AGVGSLLAGSSALLVPSTWQEPYGLVLVEAALAQVPVVGSRSGGMTEALEEDTHALFFPIGDATACADALASVLTAPTATEARPTLSFEHALRPSSDGSAEQARELLSDGMAAHERHLEELADGETPRPPRKRSRAADAGVNLALLLIPR